MLGGRETMIRAQLALLLVCWSSITSASIFTEPPKSNPLNIDWYPAPSPEDGPPLSRGASRNKALLPAQVGAIVGTYFFSACVIGIALALIGRRLRRQITTSRKALDIEMVEPRVQPSSIDNTPISPNNIPGGRNFSWPSPEKADRNPYIFPSTGPSPISPPGGGDPFVDTRIVEADREMLQRDLEDIYAHVMEQEDAKARGGKPQEMPPPQPLQGAGLTPPSEVQGQNTPPKKSDKSKLSNLDIDENKSHRVSRSSSIISSLKSPKKKGIRGMRISSPIPTPFSSTFPRSGDASDEEPLSPRYYSPPPPPPVPKDQIPYTHSRNTPESSPVSPARSIAEQLDGYPGSKQFHRTNPSQTSIQSSRDPSSATSATSQTPLFNQTQPTQPKQRPQISLQPPVNNSSINLPPSANSSTRALPFRQYEPAPHSPSFSHTTKTTVLERTSPLSPGGGPKTPWSAGAVPYSPYQPFTPMIPITPRLVTKQERKAMKNIEGRTPVLEMIKSEGEMWDSGY
jgi:hypothetical protein